MDQTAVDSETLFQDQRYEIQSFFWIKDFSWSIFFIAADLAVSTAEPCLK